MRYAQNDLAAVKRLPVLHYSEDYISISSGFIELILVTLKIEYRLSRDVSRLAPGSGDYFLYIYI